MAAPNPPNPTVAIPTGKVALWTLPWVVLLVILLILGSFTDVHISYGVYRWSRRVAAGALVALAVIGLLFALEIVGKDGSAWYTNSLLVALVLFWGLCPPAWFFTEFYLIDQNTLLPPPDVANAIVVAGKDAVAAAKVKGDHLAIIKVYADLASKVWIAVGAALATTIGLARR